MSFIVNLHVHSPHVNVIEPGLSSDPAMNSRLSQVAGVTLISNSDAHSPSKLGREANVLRRATGFSITRIRGRHALPWIPAGVPSVIPDIFYRESSIFVGSSVCNDPDSSFPLPQADQKRRKGHPSPPSPPGRGAGVRGLCFREHTPLSGSRC